MTKIKFSSFARCSLSNHQYITITFSTDCLVHSSESNNFSVYLPINVRTNKSLTLAKNEIVFRLRQTGTREICLHYIGLEAVTCRMLQRVVVLFLNTRVQTNPLFQYPILRYSYIIARAFRNYLTKIRDKSSILQSSTSSETPCTTWSTYNCTKLQLLD